MKLFKRTAVLFGLVFALTFPGGGQVLAQTISSANDGTTLKQIILFGRHSIRATITDPTQLAKMAVDAYPPFEVSKGLLTPNGRRAEALLGAYFRTYLLRQGLLTGNNRTDAERSYFRSNSIERSYETAAAFQGALIPNATESVHSFPFGRPDPVFDPILAGVAKVDPVRAVTEARALFNSGAALASAYSAEYSLIRSTLFDYPPGTEPPPPTPPNKIDPTAQAITLTAATPPYYTGGIINIGGLQTVLNATDPFVMQYADGFNRQDVAWNRLTLPQISQLTRLTGLCFDIQMRSPYLNKVQSSNAASHVLHTMQRAVYGGGGAFGGSYFRGAFGDAAARTVVVVSSDGYVAGLAGLLQMHWQLPGYQPDFCAPGGALVFELRQSQSTKQYLVRVYYTAQTYDQLRQLTPLTAAVPPATKQLLVPGGSISATNLDVDFGVFQRIVNSAIDPSCVEDPSREIPPGVLTGVSVR